jgi:hypothetical protein
MLASLGESPRTFTLDRVRNVLRDNLYQGRPDARRYPNDFGRTRPDPYVLENGYWFHPPEKPAQEFVESLYVAARYSETHVRVLDDVFLTFYQCSFRPTIAEDRIVHKTCRILAGLPATPLELDESLVGKVYENLPSGYFLNAQVSKVWDHLSVAQFVSTNIIRFALYLSMTEENANRATAAKIFVDGCADLLQAASDRLKQYPGQITTWYVVRAFLWTTWQRGIMILFSYMLAHELRGFDSWGTYDTDIVLKGTSLIRALNQEKHPFAKSVPYMCKWALELLQSERVAMGQDLRRFNERYAALFGDRSPRCNRHPDGAYYQCDGMFLENCTRFKGMKIEDQSAHTNNCSGSCQRLYWNEDSYRAMTGARAVSLLPLDNDMMQYCTASERTMAITHVWSHGQGGRPEREGTGFNYCLHQRYVRIAQGLQCDSYWMDTPCIPADHTLRAEAIQNINKTFMESQLTLVCDRDLMDIDVSKLDISLKESILATVLVCDWNVRAWTLLEAMRGRKNICLLLKDDKIITLRDLVEDVNNNGSIDIAILYLTEQHLLPARKSIVDEEGRPLYTKDPKTYSWMRKRELGYISVEEAGCILSRRHASRPGDEVVIWSLLTDEIPYYSPKTFWHGQVDKILHTSLLVSSVSRMSTMKGFSWAPSRPGLLRESAAAGRFYPHDGSGGSAYGTVTEQGTLSAFWFVHRIDNTRWPRVLQRLPNMNTSPIINRVRDIAHSHFRGCRYGLLLQMAPALEGLDAKKTFEYRGRSKGSLMVIVGSNDGLLWSWKGVHVWDNTIPLPEFKQERITLV